MSKAETNSTQTLKHSDKEASSFIQHLPNLDLSDGYYFTLLTGENRSAKKDFLKKVKKKAGGQLSIIDLTDIISTELEDTSKKIDRAFESIDSYKFIWLQNGDQLGGVYTGFSASVRRYATPQERYLLEKIRDSGKIFFLDLDDIHTVNNTMKRHAQTLITFEQPSSFLGKLKQITLHGSSFASKRKALS